MASSLPAPQAEKPFRGAALAKKKKAADKKNAKTNDAVCYSGTKCKDATDCAVGQKCVRAERDPSLGPQSFYNVCVPSSCTKSIYRP